MRFKLAIITVLSCLLANLAVAQDSLAGRAMRSLDELDHTIRHEFYDPHLRGVDWSKEVATARARLRTIRDEQEMVRVENDLLASLHTSHTALFAPSDPFYYYLASTFGKGISGYEHVFGRNEVKMPDAGFLVTGTTQGDFVQSVLEGGPADRAGLRVGDHVISVGGQAYRGTDSFRGHEGHSVAIRYQRAAGGPTQVAQLVPRLINPQEGFLNASRESAHIITRGRKRIGYYHIWAFTDNRIYDQFADILWRNFHDCDALVLDIRDGLGGGYPELLYQFMRRVPVLHFIERNGRTIKIGEAWTRPTVLLINERSRSSKELYAYAFKKDHLATLVGKSTEGAVTAGRPYFLSDGLLLYVAVAAVTVDGEVLEAKGVAPDVEIDRPIPYSQGRDPQLEKGLELLEKP